MLTVYKASAGSGKTYTLAYEYIKLVLGYKDNSTGSYHLNLNPQDAHHAILAITFTNKATDEMKRRIIKELAILAEVPSMSNEKSPYLNDLLALYNCTKEQLKETAQKVLSQLLFDYTFFNISTIDAFFQNVLRTFALEAELDGRYDVEIDDLYAVSVGLNEVFNTISYRNDEKSKLLSEWIKRFMMQKINEGSGFNIFNRKSGLFSDLLSFVSKLCGEQFKQHSEQLLNYLSNYSRITKFEEKLKEQIAIAENTIKSTANNILESLEQSYIDGMNHNVRTPILKWIKGDFTNPSNTVLKVASCEISAFNKSFTKTNPVSSDLDFLIASSIKQITVLINRLSTLKLLRNNIYGLGMIGDTMKFINEYRNNNNLILLSDTNELLGKIINENDAPFIYERLGVRLRHFLIDEFQDTSQLQWKNLNPLISESLSQNNDNLIIGDEKQCIYRFRNSDPSLLRKQVAIDFGSHITERGTQIKDNTNWRSSADIVKFNNTLFTAMATNLGLTQEYANITQQVAPSHSNHNGYIRFSRISSNELKNEKLVTAFNLMADDIKRQLDSGYRAGDIAILVRDRKDGQLAIDHLLQLMTIPESGFPKVNIVSDDTLQIDSSPTVRLILSVLRLINADIPPADSRYISKRRYNQILNRYEFHLNNGKAPNEALDDALNIEIPEIDKLVEDASNIKYTSLPSIVERIISRYVPNDLRKRDNAFITAFQDEVFDFYNRGNNDINSFLKWWDNPLTKHVVTSSTDINAIRVMTIHKSKGLEFKCVHIPICDWELARESGFGWYECPEIEGIESNLIPPIFALKNDQKLIGTPFESQYNAILNEALIDTINLTYVAFTRAIDELCVTCIASSQKSSKDIGSAIYNAFNTSTSDFCVTHASKHPDANGELFTPLNNLDEFENLIIGQPTTAAVDCEKKDIPLAEQITIQPASYYISSDRDDLWNLTRVDDFTPIDEARERGIFFHNVLSDVRHIEDLLLSIKRWGYRAQMNSDEINNAYKFLHNVISNPDVSHWFDGFDRVLNERPISTGNLNNTYRPDRIVWTSNGTIDIIDYKFGEEHKSQYEKQVKNYMNLLVNMGHKNIRGFIWYIEKNKIIEIK